MELFSFPFDALEEFGALVVPTEALLVSKFDEEGSKCCLLVEPPEAFRFTSNF